jgi:hypothetical protein
MPSSMRGQISRTAKYFVAFGTTIFDMDDAGAAMSGQLKCIFILFLTQATDVSTDFILYLGQLLPCLLCDLDGVEGRVNVPSTSDLNRIRENILDGSIKVDSDI